MLFTSKSFYERVNSPERNSRKRMNCSHFSESERRNVLVGASVSTGTLACDANGLCLGPGGGMSTSSAAVLEAAPPPALQESRGPMAAPTLNAIQYESHAPTIQCEQAFVLTAPLL